jgi:hypothetical protein
MGVSYALEVAELHPLEVAAIRADPRHNLYRIPFGEAEGKVTIRTLENLDWKGTKGEEFKNKAAKHGMLLQANDFVKKLTKKFAGVTGTVMYKGHRYPKKAIAQKFWKEIKELTAAYTEAGLDNSTAAKRRTAREAAAKALAAEIQAIVSKL